MPYILEKCVAGKTIEVSKYYTVKFHPAFAKREAKTNKSSEAQQKVNQRKACKQLRRLLNANFSDGDFLVRLDFHKRRDIDSSEMQQLMQQFLRRLRSEFKKQDKDLKYIYVKEVGPKGGRHIHLVMSKTSIEILTKHWPHGGIHIDPLNTNGQYSKIAEYFIKYAGRTEQTEGELIGKRYYSSRNLVKPKVTKKVISARQFRKEIKEKEGFYLDKDSVAEGISEVTGFEYFSYTLIRTQKQGQGGKNDRQKRVVRSSG